MQHSIQHTIRLHKKSKQMLGLSAGILLAGAQLGAANPPDVNTPVPMTLQEVQNEISSPVAPVMPTESTTPAAPANTPPDSVMPEANPSINTETPPVAPPPTTPAEPVVPAKPVFDWSADSVNQAEWSPDVESSEWASPAIARAQILLMQSYASPGAIDGVSGRNMLKAISAFEFMNGQPVDGKMDAAVWELLKAKQQAPVLATYTLTADDINHPYPNSIPSDYALQAKMSYLDYTSVPELLGERFKISQKFLKALNPQASFSQVGEVILVPNLGIEDARPIKLLVAIKKASQLYAFDQNNKMIATFPATVGSQETPSPTGRFHVKVITQKPWYNYDPANFIQGNNLKPLRLPPGPNNPVGMVWMGLSKPSYGIHGNPNPELISRNNSHGCVRVANWDALNISKRITTGTVVHLQ